MKNLILLFLIPFTMLMADFTLTGQTLTPINEDETTPVVTPSIPEATSTYSTTTGSAKTNWGFQPFTVPSDSVTVPAGGDIQAAIDSLPNGGTINLVEGAYDIQRLVFKNNMVLQGAGKYKTKLKALDTGTWTMYTSGGHVRDGIKNVILRDFELDGNRQGGATRGGMLFAYGASNLLFENIYVHDCFQSAIIVNNSTDSQMGSHYTFRNIEVRDIGWQPLSLDHLTGVVIDGLEAFNVGMAFDFSSVVYGEVSNVNVDLNKFTGFGTFAESGGGAINGAKVQGSNYIYIHDTVIKNAILIGLKLTQGSQDHGIQHLHMENITVQNSGKGIGQFGDTTRVRTYEEVIVKNVNIIDNYFNENCWTSDWKHVDGCDETQGILYPNIRLKGVIDLHEYDENIGITVASSSTLQNKYEHNGTTPEEDNVGWSTWGNP